MTSERRSVDLPRFVGTFLGMLLDATGSLALLLYALILGPLGVLRGPLVLEMAFWYLWVLLPQRLVARSARAAIDWRLGRFDAAIVQVEGILASCEEYMRQAPTSRSRRRVLEDLYTLLARAYMHAGHIDDAMMVIIRAKKTVGAERLPGLAELDAKTAHLVRAGLAAGKLLDGNGLATMFVKSNQTDPKAQGHRPHAIQGATKSSLPPGREGDSHETDAMSSSKRQCASVKGKVIPFPVAMKGETTH